MEMVTKSRTQTVSVSADTFVHRPELRSGITQTFKAFGSEDAEGTGGFCKPVFTGTLEHPIDYVPYSYRSTITDTITYEKGPAKTGGTPYWKACFHKSTGRDPLFASKFADPYIEWTPSIPTTSRTLRELFNSYSTTGTVTTEVHGTVRLALRGISSIMSSTWSMRPSVSIDPEVVTDPEQMLDSLGHAEEYATWKAEQYNRYKQLTDLNTELHSQSYFYSNIWQTLFPFAKLVSGRRNFQAAVKQLSLIRKRFGHRPFWEAVKEAGKLDLFWRFAIETAIGDIRDFMGSFDEIFRLFEIAHGHNNREWSRLADDDSIAIPLSNPYRWTLSPVFGGLLRLQDTVPASAYGLTIQNGNTPYDIAGRTLDPRYVTSYNPFSWSVYTRGLRFGVTDWEQILTSDAAAYLEGRYYTYEMAYGVSLHRRLMRWAKVRYKNLGALSPLRVWMNRVGITRPLDSVWDAIPFSFVCDYFFRVGDFVEGISQFFADFRELRGQVIDAQPIWEMVKWDYGLYGHMDTDYSNRVFAALLGLEPDSVRLVLPDARPLADGRYFIRRPLESRMKESFRLGFLNDRELSSTQKRTLAELALNLTDKQLVKGDRSTEEIQAAITQMKLKAKGWRGGSNRALESMSADQFSNYLKRTLQQAARHVKNVKR